MGERLRFAPIIRVSTEQQEQQGESLRTQRMQIQQYIKTLGGVVPDHCWQYSGQEHATAEFERHKLNALLADAGRGLFDAVIVADASRWSRDNLKSKEGLAVLREHNIRFFVGTSEYALNNPEHCFFLGMSAEIGEFQARQQSLKSITNRIERARRGIPTAGRIPYGRTFDKKTETWGVDPEAQRKIQYAADQYLSGVSMGEIAAVLGMNHANLHKILTKRAGDQWTTRFRVKRLGLDEQVTIEIPRLLPEETITAILQRAEGNKTYTHGKLRYNYLLGRMIFCARCGNAMFGQTNHGQRRYYRHPRGRKTPCDPGLWIPAEQIERAVFQQLYEVMGNPELLRSAVERATPNTEQIDRLQTTLASVTEDLRALKKKKEHLIDAVADGLVPRDEIKGRMDEMLAREELLQAERDRIRQELQTIPDHRRRLSAVTDYMKRVLTDRLGIDEQDVPVAMTMVEKARFAAAQRRSEREDLIDSVPYEDRRKLVQNVFGGKDGRGRRLGVYVDRDNRGQWTYEIRGVLGPFTAGSELNFQGVLPEEHSATDRASASKGNEQDKTIYSLS
jgi:site-specific DNA recombinase